MAFVPQSQNALVFDRNADGLSMLQTVSTTPSNRSLVDGLTGLGEKSACKLPAGRR